ncbi:GrpB family protein [Rhizobium sp. SSA_523]|uniref:GrpB family protein n=1 Tax=Rhizobium sp. SSA_523 TaxID=2952477 RepID=UPI0020902AE0|nr:GrpB family protein [Rhizobium sp. SSA_523]MCO5733394.1 GrpB family protein [Rhizobium sp. SSA_523]WKC21631.1 GrpB family protein [Rhizobium sp. SSA_523]
MALTSQITLYDDRWPSLFDAEKIRLLKPFLPNVVEIEHVGSTAVPGLAAEPEIDLVVVSDPQDEARVDQEMALLGYSRVDAMLSFMTEDVRWWVNGDQRYSRF